MKYSFNLKCLVVLTTTLFLFSSCKRTAPIGRNIICAVDFSDSKNAKERMQFYMNVIKDNVIPKLGFNDKITVVVIDNATSTYYSEILLVDFSTKNFEPEHASPKEQEQITNDNLKKYKDTLATSFVLSYQKAITDRGDLSHGTDIFSLLNIISTKGKLSNINKNYLIFLSDMMNYTKELNMEPDNNGFSKSTLDNILNKLPDNKLPKTISLILTGKEVEVSKEHFDLVDEFWKKYFEKNGSMYYDYNSGSTDKLNELMALPVQ